MKLTARQRDFVDHYVICRNGSEAARRAKYSKKTARQIATENLSKPAIQAAIAAKQAELAQSLDVDREVVVGGILGIARAEITFQTKLQRALGEQKIDVLLSYPSRKSYPPIFQIAKQTGVLL
jgi:phage terminase small subunit